MQPHVIAAYRETWAICPHWLHLALSADLAAAKPVPGGRLPKVAGGVAVLPIRGMISQRSSIWSELFGGTSTEGLAAAYSRAVNDDRIDAIVLDVDSPGGTTAGVQEAADIIRAGARNKPTVAVANSLAASAAYWLGAQAGKGKFVASPGAEVGSIGVFRMHTDYSAALEKGGVKATFIAVPQYKTEANPYQPLTDDAVSHHTAQVNATYDAFVEAVAKGRGVTTSRVKSGYGEGRTFHAQQAAEMGMVDRVATLQQILQELGVGKGAHVSASSQQAETELCESWASGIVEPIREKPDHSVRKARAKLFDTIGTFS